MTCVDVALFSDAHVLFPLSIAQWYNKKDTFQFKPSILMLFKNCRKDMQGQDMQ
jgi:hypothetical protein